MRTRMVYVEDCPFCKIASGDRESTTVLYESTDWLAFFPLNPATVGHTLIVPKSHVKDLWDADVSLGGELMIAVSEVGRAIEVALKPDGMNLITSAGKTAEQTVFHLHLHIVPRWTTDGFGPIWPLAGKADEEELEDAAVAIRRELEK